VKRALTGIGILVTRPREQSGELTRALIDAGGKVYELPAIEIIPNDADAVVSEASAQPSPDIVIFVSRNAVLFGKTAVRRVASATTRIAAIGSATRSALNDAGFEIHICPTDKFDSEHLLEQAELQDVVGKQITIVRGSSGRELLAETLTERGATVRYLATYQRKTAAVDPEALRKVGAIWREGFINTVVVMSVDSLTSLLKILPPDCHDLLRKSRLVTPSKRVIQTAAEVLPGVETVLADGPLAENLIKAINQ
jgi:uroporphyrinogen-III synthase